MKKSRANIDMVLPRWNALDGSAPEVILTSNGRIAGTATADTLTGGSGDDILIGHGGADTLSGGDGNDVLMGERTVVRNASLASVHDFAIIYNGDNGATYTPIGLKKFGHDLVVINPARVIQTTGTPGETLWTSTEVDTIKSGGALVLGYLNVAKVNDYTSEWRKTWTTDHEASGANLHPGAPDFLRDNDPMHVEANTRLVDFTKADWKDVLHARIDILIANHFNGMFLDDVLNYYTPYGVSLAESARAMRDLIIDLAAYAHSKSPTFIIMENGGPDLISHTTNDNTPLDTSKAAAFYGSIDAFLAEGYFQSPLTGQQDTYAINTTITNYGTQGVALFSADKNVSAGNSATIEGQADQAGFIPYAITQSNYGEDHARFTSKMGDASAGNDILQGGAGRDTLIGGGGADSLNGGSDADRMEGGTGSDSYLVDDAADVVVEHAGGGNDTVYTNVSYQLAAGAEVETLTAYDRTATTAMNLNGNEFGQAIYGTNGVNALIGGGGADVMAGFGGDDAYLVDSADDVVTELAGQGNDTVYTTVSYALGAGSSIETLSAYDRTTTNALTLTGNALANTIYGNDGADGLKGGGGADNFYGMGGNDTYLVDSDDHVFEAIGGGNDIVFTTGSFALGHWYEAEVETLSVYDRTTTNALNLLGNELANTIYGNEGNNVIDGLDGNDIIYLLGGADTVRFSTSISGSPNSDFVIGFTSGNDTIQLSSSIFSAIGAALAPNAFVISTTGAHDADDRIIYNPVSGGLYYDADGSGSGAGALQFASLVPGTMIAASDFVMV
jgi:uncharacterized protein (TIGR01370 family)